MKILDVHQPHWEVRSRHHTDVAADPVATYETLRRMDLSDSIWIRTLFRMRGLPARGLTLDRLARFRFYTLEEWPGDSIALGVIGRFWTLRGHLQRFDPGDFAQFNEPGFAKASWGFHVEPRGEGSRLWTETRVSTTDAASSKRFRRYWWFVAPFSGQVRREALKLVARSTR